MENNIHTFHEYRFGYDK